MADVRVCKMCNIQKNIIEFRLRNTGQYRRQCRNCERSYHRIQKAEKRKNNPTYESDAYQRRKDYILNWAKQNPKIYRYNSAKRRAAKKQATPTWADINKIKEIYLNCPEGYEVDHIIPLQGREVCGLHVEYNLQYLTQKENRKKYNGVSCG